MNKLNLSFIMSSYGDDLRCKDVHASGSVSATSVSAANVTATGNYVKVPYFATTTARDAAITAPAAGMVCQVADTLTYVNKDSNGWKTVTGT